MHIRISPSVTSYEIVCAMARSAPINAYFEFDAHPDHIMVYTDMLEIAINNNKPRLILTSGCGMGIVVHINIASVKARMGEIMNMVFDDSVGWMGSFTNSLIPSATGCKSPFGPTVFGPLRCCAELIIFRSKRVKKAIAIKVVITIVNKFIICSALIIGETTWTSD